MRALTSATPFPYTTLFRSRKWYCMREPPSNAPEADCSATGLSLNGCSGIRDTQSIADARTAVQGRSEEHTSELQSQSNLVCRLLLEKKKKKLYNITSSSTT